MSDIRYYPANTLAALNADPDLFVLEEHYGYWGVLDRALPAGVVLLGEFGKGRFFSQGNQQGLIKGELVKGERLRRLIFARPVADKDPWQGAVVVETEFYKPWIQKKTT